MLADGDDALRQVEVVTRQSYFSVASLAIRSSNFFFYATVSTQHVTLGAAPFFKHFHDDVLYLFC